MEDWVVVSPEQHPTLERTGGVSDSDVGDRPTLEEGIEQATCSRPATEPEEDGGPVYDLWGVVNHYGGLNGGHYTSFALNKHDNRWYDFSDDRVSAVESESDLVTSAAYVLFYQRREGGSGEGGRA